MKFKNLRRPPRAEKVGIVILPLNAKAKDEVGGSDGQSVSAKLEDDDETYNQHVKFLKQSFNSSKWSLASIANLLEETSSQRRWWISNQKPLVETVLEKFPCLTDPTIVGYHVSCICDVSNA